MKKEKYLQIFNYLLEFSKLRSKPVRDIENSEAYPEVVWFNDIPQYESFDCVTFQNYNKDTDYWIKISKPKGEPQPPKFPKLTETLTDWIVKESLIDENGTPKLKEHITKKDKIISLSDKPGIIAEFETYLNNKWIDDLELFKDETANYEIKLADYEKQIETYKRFFSIYNKAQQFADEFELIVGVGLLNFREDGNSHLICRHILTSKVEIIFDSSISVIPSIENEIKIETDAILDLIYQFESANVIDAVSRVSTFLKEKNISGNPFDLQIKDAIQIFADRIRTDGESSNELSKPKDASKKPIIYFAPALILRKRNTRSFSALYEKIIDDIENSDESIDIPSINDIIGFFEQEDGFTNEQNEEDSTEITDESIYFPKSYNDEQIEIIEKIRRHNKVLVQGPPGTGKSHTIANLICHLLANGKKILVTASTKRALEVIKGRAEDPDDHGKLPDEFRKLAVSLLGGDSTSIKDLDSSVNAINDELSKITNLNRYKSEIEEKEIELSLLKQKKANTKNEWLKVKEKSTRRLDINKNYQGTITEIAERIEKDVLDFAWFKDELNDFTKIELRSDIENFISFTRYYQSKDCNIYNFIIPQKEKLLSLSELTEYYKTTNELVRKHSAKEEFSSINCKDYSELKKLLQLLHRLFLEIENNVFPFKEKLIKDYRNNYSFWKDKLTRTVKILSELPDEKLIQFERNVEVTYPIDKGLIQLKSDAEFLLQLLSEGKKLRGLLSVFNNPLATSNVKQRKYFIQGVKVNGRDCDTIQEFKTVLTDIKTKQDFEELKTIWEIEPNGNSKSYFDKANFYRQLKNDTENLIKLLDETSKIKEQIETISSLRIQVYSSAKVHDLIEDTEYNFLLLRAKLFKEKIVEANNHLSIQNVHPIATSIIKTVANNDIANYEQHLLEIDILNSEKEKFRIYKNLQSNLQKHLPILVNEILENTFEFSNLNQYENAIYYKHAISELEKLLAEDSETKLTCQISDLELQEKNLISNIASRKAWLHIMVRLSKNPMLQQHLTAWKLAVRSIPKTRTSPNYHHYRKLANKEMEYCKQSVACWIMPLYQVVENFIPEPAMFDYVIIDEASQLGPDAVFLFYISKNIIVVGDDKQTAPEYVGVDDGMVKTMIHKYLKPTPTQEIPYADFYGTKHSFFDHCDLLCAGKRIVLREHFRCMPEIIEFSNKLFYAPDGKGLYPLKQHTEKRLKPLETFYCQNGYTDGSYSNITNKVEAEEIAKKIAEIIKDENYFKIEDGVKKPKTIGVISLQGNSQSKIIESKLMDLIGSDEMKNRKILCGNSASFQGDERDIIFLSMIVASSHRGNALTKAEDERRFNVAVSRAQEQIWLFHSLQLEDLQSRTTGVVDLRYKLLDHFRNYKENRKVSTGKIGRKIGSQPSPFESWFEVDVHDDIVDKGYSVIPQYEVVKGKHRIDLAVVFSNGVKIAVECDGDAWHGPDQAWADAGRQGFLERIGGWQFFRVRGGEYYSNRIQALEPLWKLLKANENHVVDNEIKSDEQNKINKPKTEIINAINPISISTNIKKPSNPIHQVELFNAEKQIEINFVDKDQIIFASDNTIRRKPENLFSLPEFLVFTSMQNVYKIKNRNYITKTEIFNDIELEPGEKPIYLTGTKNYVGFLLVAFENGKVGKITFKSYQTEQNRKKLKHAFSIESRLIFIEHAECDFDLVGVSNINKVVLFNTSQINPVESRSTKGVQVMKQKDNSKTIKVKRLEQTKLIDPEYYRKSECLNVVGYYLKPGDEI